MKVIIAGVLVATAIVSGCNGGGSSEKAAAACGANQSEYIKVSAEERKALAATGEKDPIMMAAALRDDPASKARLSRMSDLRVAMAAAQCPIPPM